MNCVICNKEIQRKFPQHLRMVHNIPSVKDYYDAYLKKEGDGICVICGKQTEFRSHTFGNIGYRIVCSPSCRMKYTHQIIKNDPDKREKWASRAREQFINAWKDPNHRSKWCENASKVMTKRIKAGFASYGHHSFEDGYEFKSYGESNFYKAMKSNMIRCFYEAVTLHYKGDHHTYTPDFILPDLNLIVEIKYSDDEVTSLAKEKLEGAKSILGFDGMFLIATGYFSEGIDKIIEMNRVAMLMAARNVRGLGNLFCHQDREIVYSAWRHAAQLNLTNSTLGLGVASLGEYKDMPLVITSTLPAGSPNILKSARAAAVWCAIDSLVPAFSSTLVIENQDVLFGSEVAVTSLPKTETTPGGGE